MTRTLMCALAAGAFMQWCCLSAPARADERPRIGVSGGMGVSYVSAQDIVDLANSRSLGGRVTDFKAAVEFFGAASVPLSSDWALKLEYAYILGTYNVTNPFGALELSFVAHMPSVMVQYILIDERVYNVKAGIGGGYHVGSYIETSSYESRYSGSGFGATADIEANTAFGDDFFGYIGGDLRWEFIGDLRNGSGQSPNGIPGAPAPTLHFFGVGARLGFSYYF